MKIILTNLEANVSPEYVEHTWANVKHLRGAEIKGSFSFVVNGDPQSVLDQKKEILKALWDQLSEMTLEIPEPEASTNG